MRENKWSSYRIKLVVVTGSPTLKIVSASISYKKKKNSGENFFQSRYITVDANASAEISIGILNSSQKPT